MVIARRMGDRGRSDRGASARFVLDHETFGAEFLGLDDVVDGPGVHIAAAAGCIRNDDIDRLGRFEFGGLRLNGRGTGWQTMKPQPPGTTCFHTNSSSSLDLLRYRLRKNCHVKINAAACDPYIISRAGFQATFEGKMISSPHKKNRPAHGWGAVNVLRTSLRRHAGQSATAVSQSFSVTVPFLMTTACLS